MFCGGAALWGLTLAAFILYFFFPYQKALAVAFQNALGTGSRTAFLVDGVRLRNFGIDASRIVVGQQGPENPPVLELSHIKIRWNPLSILKGTLSIYSEASLYDGQLSCTISGVPVFRGDRPDVFITFRNVNLAKYPEGRFPWFKGLSGTATGWIRKEPVPGQPAALKGGFSITVMDGEIREIKTKNWPRLVLPFKEIVTEGAMLGATIDLARIFFKGPGIVVKGRGFIEAAEADHRLAIQLVYEAPAGGFPLPGHGTITVSGTQLSPQVSITPRVAESAGSARERAPKQLMRGPRP